MRCPLCEPHGLGMGLELLLCVPSASRRTHTARTAPYGTVVCVYVGLSPGVAPLLTWWSWTWLGVVDSTGAGVSTVVTLLQPVRAYHWVSYEIVPTLEDCEVREPYTRYA